MKTIYLSLAAALLVSCSPDVTAPVPTPEPVKVEIITIDSQNSFSISDSQLKEAIEKRDLELFAIVNHGEGAMSVATPIGQSKLYIFGNPKSGTPLMKGNEIIGLELPMKILVYEDDGVVKLARKDMRALMASYDVNADKALLDKISRTLDMITYEAAN